MYGALLAVRQASMDAVSDLRNNQAGQASVGGRAWSCSLL